MSGAAERGDTRKRQVLQVREVLFPALGLVVWAAHFGVSYAANALACARGFADARLLGQPLVPAVIMGLTAVALLALGLVIRASLSGLEGSLEEGGEAEPRFTRWLAATAAALAALAVLFQAVPALSVPPCG